MLDIGFIRFSSDTYMSASTEWLHMFVQDLAYFCINVMELISIFIIVLVTLIAFWKMMTHQPFARVYLLHGQSIGLTFKLGAEILRTIPARTIDDIWEIILLIVVKVMMGLLIEYELKTIEDPQASDGIHHNTGMPVLFTLHGNHYAKHFNKKNTDTDSNEKASQ
jgi:uncharacterized membrane protein